MVLFAGNHGYIADLSRVLETAQILEAHPEILFLFAGEGSVKQDLITQAQEMGLQNVVFLPTQPKKRWIEMLSAADLGLVTLKKELAELNVPSKVYTLMAAACPILASVPTDSEIVKLIEKAKCGIVIQPESPGKMADAILRLKDDSDKMKKFAKNGRRYLLEYLSRQTRTHQYHRLLVSLSNIGK